MEVRYDESDGELENVWHTEVRVGRTAVSECNYFSVRNNLGVDYNSHNKGVKINGDYYSVVKKNNFKVYSNGDSSRSKSNYKYKRRYHHNHHHHPCRRGWNDCLNRSKGGCKLTEENLLVNNSVNSVKCNPVSIVAALQYFRWALQYVRGVKMLSSSPNFMLLTAIVVTYGLLGLTEAGVCWTKRLENGKCTDMYMNNISKEECCNRGQEFGFTEQRLSEVEIFFASAIGDGAKCEPCLDSCHAAKCKPGRMCVIRKGRPKCICAPQCRGSKDKKHKNNPIQVIDVKHSKPSDNAMNSFGFFGHKKLSSISSSNVNDNINNNNNNNNKRKRNTELSSSAFLQTTSSIVTTTEKFSEKKRNQRINSNNNNNNNNNKNNLKLNKRLRQQLSSTTVSSSSDSSEKIPFTSLDKTLSLSSSTSSSLSSSSSSTLLSSTTTSSSNLVKSNNKLLIANEGISQNNLGKLGNYSFKRNKKNSNMTSKTIVIVQSNSSATTFGYDSDDHSYKSNDNNNNNNNNNNNQNSYNSNNSSSSNTSNQNIRNNHQNENEDHRNRHQYNNKKKKKKKQRNKVRDQQQQQQHQQQQQQQHRSNARNTTGVLGSTSSSPRRQHNHRHHQRQHTNNNEDHQLHHNSHNQQHSMQIHHQHHNDLQHMQNHRRDPSKMMTLDEKIGNEFFNHGFPYPPTDLSLISQDPYYNPVCGTDGKTYKTECQLKKRACRQDRPSLIVAYRGQCQTSCEMVRCVNDLTCVEDQYGIPHCISCKITCPQDDVFPPIAIDPKRAVCGADGHTYKSICDINRVVCRIGRSIPVAYEGPCRDAPNCDNVVCGDKKVCLTDLVTHKPRCVSCNFKCPRKRRPQGQRYEDTKLCGNNNHTYHSWCHLRRDSCNTGIYIDIRHNGACHKGSFPSNGIHLFPGGFF